MDSLYYNSYANSVAIQKDGKIVAVGSADGSHNEYVIIRYNTDGSPDSTFGGDGTEESLRDDGVANAVAIQSDGTIVVVLNSTDYSYNISLVSYNTDGSLIKLVETGFGTDLNDYAAAVAVQSDDKIVVAGRSGNHFALARFNKHLSTDSSFSNDGKQITAAIPRK